MPHSRDDDLAHDHRRVVVAASIGTFIEVYDLSLYGLFAVFLAAEFFPQQDPDAALLSTFAIFAVAFLVRPAGALVWGPLGDRIGRRATLALSLLVMTAATVAFGLLPTYDSVGLLAPVLLLVCRMLQGLSVSAELPGAQLLMLEHAPEGRRGRIVAINSVAAALGVATATTVALVLARALSPDQMAAWGWRAAFLIAAVIGVVGLYIRTRVADSPAFIALGDRARRDITPLATAVRTAKRRMVVLTVWLAVTYASGYVVSGYLPAYLIRTAGFPPADAFTISLIMTFVSAVSSLVGGYLIDRFPLQPLMITLMAAIAIATVPGFLVITEIGTFWAVVGGQAIWVIFLSAALPVGAVMSLTLFPVAIRFTTGAISLNLASALFGSTAPYVCTWLVAETNNPVAPGYYVLLIALLGLIAVTVGLPRRPAPGTS
jgi:MFS transporter, MHS family, proline/betaine transporter